MFFFFDNDHLECNYRTKIAKKAVFHLPNLVHIFHFEPKFAVIFFILTHDGTLHDGTLSFRNFIMKVKKFKIHNFCLFWPTAMIRPKSQNFKLGHDGILSIGNFILMIKNHILFFSAAR
jgi:hypothetical protein